MLLNNNCTIENETKLGSIHDSLESLSNSKKLSVAETKNLTLKRKRLVRQEAVTQYEENKNTSEQNASDLEDKSNKILALQSESTGSTETVIEAPEVSSPLPPSPTVTATSITASVRHKRPDNLDVGTGSNLISNTSQRKSSNGHYSQFVSRPVKNISLEKAGHSNSRRQDSSDGADNTVSIDKDDRLSGGRLPDCPGSGSRRKASHENSRVANKSSHSNARAVSLTSGHKTGCPTHSLEMLGADVWEMQSRRLSSVSSHLQDQEPVPASLGRGRPRRSAAGQGGQTQHLRSQATSHPNTAHTQTLPRPRPELTRGHTGSFRHGGQSHHYSHDNPYYQSRSSEKSEHSFSSTLDRSNGPQSREKLVPETFFLDRDQTRKQSTNHNSDGVHNLATPNSLLILVGFALLLIVVVMIILMHRVESSKMDDRAK